MLGYYFKIWQNIERDERGSIWRRFATNAPFSAKVFLIVLILCLFGIAVSTLLPSDFAFNVQSAVLAFTLVLSFFYSILLNRLKRKTRWTISGAPSSRLSGSGESSLPKPA